MTDRLPAPLSRTDIARAYREVYGEGCRFDGLKEEFARRIERATVEAMPAYAAAVAQELEEAANRAVAAIHAIPVEHRASADILVHEMQCAIRAQEGSLYRG